MASIKKLKTGRWQAQVARQGVRRAKSFHTKREAQDWAARQEFLISEGVVNGAAQPFGDILDRYAREVSQGKRGARWEQIRIDALRKDDLAKVKMRDLKASDFASWRDRRLQEVSGATVVREMNLLSAVLSIARREWGLIQDNPLSDVGRPKSNPPRDRRVTNDEIEALVERAGTDLTQMTPRAVHAFRFAIETGMRAGEIVGLTWDDIDIERRVASLARTKNGYGRQVPLSSAAVDLLNELPGGADTCFDLTSAQVDSLFRRARDGAKIKGLRFHDSRHEAITRLAKKLDVLSLARMVGHRDIRMLQIYYNETAEEMAERLD